MVAKVSRRIFLYFSGLITGGLLLYKVIPVLKGKGKIGSVRKKKEQPDKHENLGVANDGKSYVYISKNKAPEENIRNVIDMMGGIKRFVDPDDIVLLKPNAQWWNQGTTNTNSMKAFIEMVLEIPGFEGEVIIGENHHFPKDNSRGWNTEMRNGDYNLNELVEYFQKLGQANVTKYHWHDGGSSKPNLHGGAEKGGVVKGPWEGDGYVWREDLVYTAPSGRKSIMSYPVFTSEYSGIKIDFCKGPWKDGEFLKRKLKFINFSALNHHRSTGVTASVKNYLGICDLTCGFRGEKPKGFFNFHFIGGSVLHWRVKELLAKFGWQERLTSIGGCVGYFMENVRMADLNIVTAEWTGYGSRIDTNLRSHTKAILASVDPVALDFIAARDVLLQTSYENTDKTYLKKFHDPESDDSPFYQFLLSCHNMGIGNLKKDMIEKIQFG